MVKDTFVTKLGKIGNRIIPKFFLPTIREIYNKCYYDNFYYKNYEKPLIDKIIAAHSESDNSEIQGILKFISNNGLISQPYEWANPKTYDNKKILKSIRVYRDNDKKLMYTYLNGKRIYFPASWDKRQIKRYFFSVQLVEQHPQSPHHYLDSGFDVDGDSIVVDCGVAEGNFGLSVVEKCKTLYLFEPDEIWMEPLRATFAPWEDKVVIVQKYLSNVSDENNISLDEYFSDKPYPNFLKLDVEGYEESILLGSKNILKSGETNKVAICVYHKADDESRLGNILKDSGFTLKVNQGYCLLSVDKIYPYIRHCVMQAEKSTTQN